MTEFNRRYCTVRQEIIARDFSAMNPQQRKAVMATEGPLLLLAGAGSGKTTVLIQRVANLLTYGRASDTDELPEDATEADLAFLERYAKEPTEEDRARATRLCAIDPAVPWSVIAITFTNKAAGELKERLAARLGTRGNDVWASTFHSACVKILRRDADKIGFPKNFTIYDTDDSKRVIKEISKDFGFEEKELPPREVLSILSKSKDTFESPQDFAQRNLDGGDWKRRRVARIYVEYAKRLRDAGAMDFDDIIYHTVTLLQQYSEVREFYQKKFRYVLVDEYQDTNHLQYLLTGLLAGGYKNICVVGDDDQSIYRFRGANIENILSFEKQYRGARVIRLEQNYRSSQNILDAANAVIRNNTGRKGKTLWTENDGGDKVTIKTNFNEGDEANFVVSSILSDCRRGRSFSDSAILYRTNAQSNALEQALRRSGVAYHVVGGLKFFDRAEVKDMLSYLCVINNPADDLRLKRVINVPARGIGPTTVDRVQAIARQEGCSLYEVLQRAEVYPELHGAVVKLQKFAVMIGQLQKFTTLMELPELYEEVCTATGYVRTLEEKDDLESRARLENVRELKSNIAAFLENAPEDPSLAGFLNEMALYTDLDSVNEQDDSVTLMTIHSAKGLEFPSVYVVGMEENIFPGTRSVDDPEEMEEERRLCYVAMTRAKEKLTLTNARQRMLYGKTGSNQPSRFLMELPAENMEWLSRPEPRLTARESADGISDYSWDTRPAARQGATAIPPKKATMQRSTAPAAPLLQLGKGDRVEHSAFGLGEVVSVRAMGGDALIEVAFETAGSKKLMLKSAGNHMKKV
ncbi:MAG: 3'-5' exonuclease [Oscillospiraceae bacterium]